MENKTSFPVRKMPIKLKKIEPTKLTPEALQKQMYGIGLHCESTSIENLTTYKAQVLQELHSTGLQTWQISRPENGFSEIAFLNGELGSSDEPYIEGALKLVEAAKGEWVWDDSAAGYQQELTSIQIPAHFDYLMSNRPGFAGRVKKVERSQQLKSVDAIKGLYIDTAYAASSTLSEQINKESVESFYSNVISPLSDKDVKKDYDSHDSRVLFLTLNHVGNNCDGVGVINISYDFHIKNYQRKEKKGGDYHDTSITVLCRGVFYSSLEVLEGDYNAIRASFKNSRCLMNYPRELVPVEVFGERPPAGPEAFVQGVPSALTDTYTDCIILHSPHTEELKAASSAGRQGFALKNTAFPVSGISYVIKAPASDALQAPFAEPIRLVSTDRPALASSFENPVDLRRTVYKADILRHSLEDGSYKYIESGEYYGGCAAEKGEAVKAFVRCPAEEGRGEWSWNENPEPYTKELAAIAVPGNFDYLISSCPDFNGKKVHSSSRRQLPSMEAVRDFFASVARKAISSFSQIDEAALDGYLSNVSMLFNGKGRFSTNQTLFLSLNHRSDQCSGAGAVNCGFDVEIKDCGRGSCHFDVSVSCSIRGVFYTSPDELLRDYELIRHKII